VTTARGGCEMKLVQVGDFFTWRNGKDVYCFKRLPDETNPAWPRIYLRVEMISASPLPPLRQNHRFTTEQEWFRVRGFRAV
jgi:hypothetical protein